MIIDTRIRSGNNVIQIVPLSGPDQILQINRPIKMVVFIFYIDCLNIIILPRLANQLRHGLPNGQVISDENIVGGHETSDLILIIRQNQLNIPAGLIIHETDQLLLNNLINLFQNIDGVIGIHLRNNLCRSLDRNLLQILIRIFQISKNLGGLLRSQDPVHTAPFLTGKLLHGSGDIIFMIIVQKIQQFLFTDITPYDLYQFFLIIRILSSPVFHVTPPSSIFSDEYSITDNLNIVIKK